MRGTAIAAAILALGLTGCGEAPSKPNGCIAYSPAIPLVASLGRVCATQLDEHWAVSVRHGDDQLVFERTIVDPDYDLVFFRHEGTAPEWRDAVPGESATAEGNPGTPLDFLVALPIPTRETARGPIEGYATFCGTKELKAKCTRAIIFRSAVELGYSGGPLIGDDGRVIGVIDARSAESANYRHGIAYPTALIWERFRVLVPAAPAPAAQGADDPRVRCARDKRACPLEQQQ